MNLKNISHVLLNNGWIPVDEGTFDGLEVRDEIGFIMVNEKKCVKFLSEKKMIICPFDSILAVKFK